MIDIQDGAWTLDRLPDALADLGVEPRGVIHVGAHHGEEVPVYQQCGFRSITLVEPDPENCAVILAQPWHGDVALLQYACGTGGYRATFHRSSNGVFSGLIPNAAYPVAATFEVPIVRVSTAQLNHLANVLVVDTQGTEMDVLASADLSTLDLIVVESQETGPTAHGAYWPDLVAWAAERGWRPAIRWVRENSGWADTLLVRSDG